MDTSFPNNIISISFQIHLIFHKTPPIILSKSPTYHFISIHTSHLFSLLGLCVIMEIDSSPERKKHHKGGRILRYEPSNCNHINSYPFIKQCFEDVHYFKFCKRVSEAGFYEQLTDWVATHLKGDK